MMIAFLAQHFRRQLAAKIRELRGRADMLEQWLIWSSDAELVDKSSGEDPIEFTDVTIYRTEWEQPGSYRLRVGYTESRIYAPELEAFLRTRGLLK